MRFIGRKEINAMIWKEKTEIWPGDPVWYTPGNQREQAEIISLGGNTQAHIRILTGPETGREVVAPWGIISPVDRPWRRYDPDDIRTYPEELSRVDAQFRNGRCLKVTYRHPFGAMDGSSISLEKSRWRYQVPPDVDECFKWLCARRSAAKRLNHRNVRAEGFDARRNQCHENAKRWASLNLPYFRPVHGWLLVSQDESGRCHFEAHSVIEDAFGKLFDITLNGQEECDLYPFLRHLGSDDQFRAMAIEGNYRQVTYPPITPEELMSDGTGNDDEEPV